MARWPASCVLPTRGNTWATGFLPANADEAAIAAKARTRSWRAANMRPKSNLDRIANALLLALHVEECILASEMRPVPTEVISLARVNYRRGNHPMGKVDCQFLTTDEFAATVFAMRVLRVISAFVARPENYNNAGVDEACLTSRYLVQGVRSALAAREGSVDALCVRAMRCAQRLQLLDDDCLFLQRPATAAVLLHLLVPTCFRTLAAACGAVPGCPKAGWAPMLRHRARVLAHVGQPKRMPIVRNAAFVQGGQERKRSCSSLVVRGRQG